MAISTNDAVITEAFWEAEGQQIWIKRAVLVVLGVIALAICAKIKFPLPPSPVPINLGTFAVLTIGAAYGPRLGAATLLAYMLVGALGFDVFVNSSAENNGWAYMTGSTGGYLVGFVLATIALGVFARMGWDRNVGLMAIAMLIGNVIIYALGVAWLHALIADGSLPFMADKFSSLWQQTLAWGFWPFLIGDALKIVMAAILLPVLWKAIGAARA
ncbi:MAG: biotin transporter BioY [Pseudomonadota bacterium]